MLAPLYFYVNIFPLDEWRPFVIERSSADTKRGYINVEDVYVYARSVLTSLNTETENLTLRDLAYDVNVLLATTPNNKTKKLVETTLKEYGVFFDEALSKALLTRVNEEDKDFPFGVLLEQFTEARVILFPAIRDLARIFYKTPKLPASLGYEITIYGDTNDELRDLSEYIDRLLAENNKLPLLLRYPVAMGTSLFPALSRIIFIARRKGRIIGYCGCTLLPYRVEIAPQMERAIDESQKNFGLGSSSPIMERFFMGVRPRNVFEIEGLSVSPDEAGKQVGLALLYQAMHFVRDPVMRVFYPTSHIVSNAASYITKRMLLLSFNFRYHGGNTFMNEGFVEVIGDTSKQQLVRTITDLVHYYSRFFGTNNRLFVRSRRTTNEQQIVTGVMKLYQLYYLLLKWSRPSSLLVVKRRDTINAFVELFDELAVRLQRHETDALLYTYFSVASSLLNNYDMEGGGGDTDIMDRIGETIVWDDGSVILYDDNREALPPKYGFMTKGRVAVDVEGVEIEGGKYREKTPYTQGYDVIYSVLPSIIEMAVASGLPQSEQEKLATHVLAPINQIVQKDLALPFSYESPGTQLSGIIIALTELSKSGLMASKIDTLRSLLEAVQTKTYLINQNIGFNIFFTGAMYNVFEAVFDCYTSTDSVATQWQQIGEGVMAKFGARPAAITVSPVIETKTSSSPPLVLPRNREELFEQINILYDIIWPNIDGPQSNVLFNGASYSVAELTNHFNRLKGMEYTTTGAVVEIEIIDTSEEDMTMQVEGIPATYRVQDFMDDNDSDTEVLNRTLI